MDDAHSKNISLVTFIDGICYSTFDYKMSVIVDFIYIIEVCGKKTTSLSTLSHDSQ